ncbi:MAG: transcription termination/antitermination protein NusA [Leptospiraceae bacterium]|nr:transcription termination/antitermination protein NusA [Leptospiraceae bacterium]
MPRGANAQNTPRKSFFDTIHQITSDRGFDRDEVFQIVEAGLLAAYRKKYKTLDNARVFFDREKEDVVIVANREVVDNVVLPGMQIHIDEAVKMNPEIKIGDKIDVEEHPMEYGRIAAQTAMQVVTQKIKTLEQNKIREEYSDKIGELMNGFILRKKGDLVFVDLGKVEAILPPKQQIPNERYRVEEKIKVLLQSIEYDTYNKGLKVVVSRADRRFVQKLFEMEVPEIYDGNIQIKAIGRAPGLRSKVVVASTRGDIDPVGACVGMRGVRIQSIVRELGNERVDIVEFNEDPREFIRNAMSPGVPVEIKIDHAAKEALVVVPDKDLSIAIGRDGSNVKLASYVTGFRIDLKTESQFSEEMSSPEARRRLDELFTPQPVEEEEVEGTDLTSLPGLTPRIIRILNDHDIKYVEDLVEMGEDDLIALEGMGRATAKRIMEILAENVEFEEVEEDEAEETEDTNETTGATDTSEETV